MHEKLKISDIKLESLEGSLNNGELGDTVYSKCNFCSKTVELAPMSRRYCERLSGKGFYCNFCLRHGFNTRNNRNILILSFRPIIGYLYTQYSENTVGKLYKAELYDFINRHQVVGEINPVFTYDPETFLWFINFSRIGKNRTGNKIPLRAVLATVINILACFNLPQFAPAIQMTKFVDKYMSAMQKFYTERYRPDDRQYLIPTLQDCGIELKKVVDLKELRGFLPEYIH